MPPFRRSARTGGNVDAISSSATSTRRGGGSHVEHDLLEGLPVRRWERRTITVSQAPKSLAEKPEDENDPIAPDFRKEMPLPKDFTLLPLHSQELLRATRRPRFPKYDYPQSGAEKGDVGEDKESPKSDDDAPPRETHYSFTIDKWVQVPRNLESSEHQYLAPRRKGLLPYSVTDTTGGESVALPLKKVKVRKVDAESGQASIFEVLVPEGQHVEGEISEENAALNGTGATEIHVETLAPGTVLEGVGVANAEGVIVASGVEAPTRRKPPPPKRKMKGPGRGRKKKVMFAPGEGVDASGVHARTVEATPNGASNNVAGDSRVKQEGDVGAVSSANIDQETVDQDHDDDDNDDEGEDNEDGSDAGDESGDESQSPTPAAGDPGASGLPAAATSAPSAAGLDQDSISAVIETAQDQIESLSRGTEGSPLFPVELNVEAAGELEGLETTQAHQPVEVAVDAQDAALVEAVESHGAATAMDIDVSTAPSDGKSPANGSPVIPEKMEVEPTAEILDAAEPDQDASTTQGITEGASTMEKDSHKNIDPAGLSVTLAEQPVRSAAPAPDGIGFDLLGSIEARLAENKAKQEDISQMSSELHAPDKGAEDQDKEFQADVPDAGKAADFVLASTTIEPQAEDPVDPAVLEGSSIGVPVEASDAVASFAPVEDDTITLSNGASIEAVAHGTAKSMEAITSESSKATTQIPEAVPEAETLAETDKGSPADTQKQASVEIETRIETDSVAAPEVAVAEIFEPAEKKDHERVAEAVSDVAVAGTSEPEERQDHQDLAKAAEAETGMSLEDKTES